MAGYAEAEEIIPVVGGGQGKARDGPAAVAGDAPSAEARAKYRAKILLEETRADRASRAEIEHAQIIAAQVYQQMKSEYNEDDIQPLKRFALAAEAIRQLAGVLSAAEGLHNLRKTLEDEWFKETLKDRPANQQLIEEFETCCHSPQSPHLPNDNTLHPNSVPLDPMSQFRRIWDFLQIKILMYIAIFVPFRVCFDAPALPWSWDFILDIAVDIYFVADIILCFNTAYQRHSDGKMEWSRRLVTRHYLKTWFLIDLVASLPINYIPFIADAGSKDSAALLRLNKTARLLRFTKLLKLLRLVRIRRILERYEQELGVLHSTAGNCWEIFKLTAAIFFVGHVLCCFWFLAGEDELHRDCTPTNEVDCVRTEGWITTTELRGNDVTKFDQYLKSLYWGMTTMTTVGYGDISASTTAEQIYCIIAMLIGGFMFGVIIGSLSNIIASASPLESNKKTRLAEVSEWLQLRSVPIHLRADIYEFFRTLYTEGCETGLDEHAILRELPYQMAQPLVDHIFNVDSGIFKMQCWHSLRLDTLPYFTQVEVATALRPLQVGAHHVYNARVKDPCCIGAIKFFRKRVAYEEERQRAEGTIFQEGVDDDRSIYIIQEGMVDITREDRNEVVRLKKGDSFGESCLLYIDDDAKYSRNFSAYAATDCKLLMLNRNAIKSLPDAAIERLKPLSMRRQERIHKKAMEKLREEGVNFDESGNAVWSSHTGNLGSDDAVMITRVVTQTANRLSREIRAVVRDILVEEKKDQETEMRSIMGMLEHLNQKVDALAAK